MNNISKTSATVDPIALAAEMARTHVADVVELLNAEPLERSSAILSAMTPERATEVLDQPGLEAAADGRGATS